jgi:hypothetical protein
MKNETNSAKRGVPYMSQDGRIECGEHTPYRGSDSWVWEDWQPITRAEALAFEREVGRPPACETCAAIALRAAGK